MPLEYKPNGKEESYVSRDSHKNCMLDRNRFLVKYADLLLAVYNGERRGGTAVTVRYARKSGLEITVIDPVTRLIVWEGPAPPPSRS